MSAVISDCGKYRYVLRRQLNNPGKPFKPCLFIMLNPSTADSVSDDPTIRRCISFAKREGCTELTVINKCAYRATNPKELDGLRDPCGPENVFYCVKELEKHSKGGLIIAAWGSNKWGRDLIFPAAPPLTKIYSLGENKDGTPKHPLYVKADAPLIRFPSYYEKSSD